MTTKPKKTTKQAKLEQAIDALAATIPGGALMVSTGPCSFLLSVRDELLDARRERDACRASVAELERERDELRGEADRVRATAASNGRHCDEAIRLIDETEQQRAELERERDAARAESESLRQQLSALAAEVETGARMLEEERQGRARFAVIAHEKKVELGREVAELRERTRTIAVALRELSPGPHPGPMDAEEYLPLVAKRIAELETGARLLEAERQAHAAEVAELRQAVDLAHAEHAPLEQKRAELAREVEQLKALNAKGSDEYQQLRQRAVASYGEAEALRRDLQGYRETLERYSTANLGLAAERTELAEKVRAAEEREEQLEQRVGQLEAACRSAVRAGVGRACFNGQCGKCPTCRVAAAISEQCVRVPDSFGSHLEVLNARARAKCWPVGNSPGVHFLRRMGRLCKRPTPAAGGLARAAGSVVASLTDRERQVLEQRFGIGGASCRG